MSQERQVREAELQLEINKVLLKRAKFRAEEASRTYEDVVREIEATNSRCVLLCERVDTAEGVACGFEKELRQFTTTHWDRLGSASASMLFSMGEDRGITDGHPHPGDMNIIEHLTSSFDGFVRSIQAIPNNLRSERAAAEQKLQELISDRMSAQEEMDQASIEEGHGREEVAQQEALLESLKAQNH